MTDWAKATEETAKAVQEVAKVAPRALETLDDAGGFFARVFGGAITEVGMWLQDIVAYRRENLAQVRGKAALLAEHRGIVGTAKQIHPRYGVPLLEASSLEDNPILQDIWANLIVNAADPDKVFDIRRLTISIISHLEPIDASILEYLGRIGSLSEENKVKIESHNVIKIMHDLNADKNSFILSIYRLDHLRLLEYHTNFLSESITTTSVTHPDTCYGLSPLGFLIYEATRST